MMHKAHCLRCGQHHFYNGTIFIGDAVPRPTCGGLPVACPNCLNATQVVVGRKFLEWARTNPMPCIEALVPA